MCCDTQLKEKFNKVGLKEFYKSYLDKEKYPAFYKHALAMVSLCRNTNAALISPELTQDRQRRWESIKRAELLER